MSNQRELRMPIRRQVLRDETADIFGRMKLRGHKNEPFR